MTRTARFPISAARLFSGAVLVAVLGTAALSVWAYGGPGAGMMHGGPGAGMMHDGPGIGMMQGRMGERMLDIVNATPEQRTQLRADLGLDKSFPVQFAAFVGNALRGEFGLSLRQGRKVGELKPTRASQQELVSMIVGAEA